MSRAWCIGNNISTDEFIPGYIMKLPLEEMKPYVLKNLLENFSNEVKDGDILIAGKNLGTGSSREQAASILKLLGIKAVFAKSLARIFYRNLIAAGVNVFVGNFIETIENQNEIELDLINYTLEDVKNETIYKLDKQPKEMELIIKLGGIINYSLEGINEKIK